MDSRVVVVVYVMYRYLYQEVIVLRGNRSHSSGQTDISCLSYRRLDGG